MNDLVRRELERMFRVSEAAATVVLGSDLKPLSLNAMYESSRRGGIKLTDRGRAYLNQLKFEISRQLIHQPVSPWVYVFLIVQCEDRLTTKSFIQEAERSIRMKREMKRWKVTKSKKTGSVEKRPVNHTLLVRKDADGPMKKVQDVFFSASGIDDCHALFSASVRVRGDTEETFLYLIPMGREYVTDQVQVSEEVMYLWTSFR